MLKALVSMGLAALVFAPQTACAEDVYNFYFQKGPGPQTVIQGGGGQTASAEAASVPPIRRGPQPLEEESVAPALKSQTTVLAPPPTTETKYRPFEILAGLSQISDDLGSSRAYSLAAQYNFNRFIGLRAQGHFLAPEDDEKAKAQIHPDEPTNRWGGLASFVFTPIQVELIGHRFIDISAHAGVLSQRILGPKGTDGLNAVEVAGRGFVGAGVTLALNENLGVEGFASLMQGGQLGQVGGSLVFQF